MDDLDLKDLIESELEFDTSLDASGIGVTVQDGIVTLSGHVGTYAEKLAAERCATRIKGVRGLAQEIAVRYPNHKQVADDEVAARALRIIDWDTTIPDGSIQVKVQNGWITLSGEVEWGFQRVAAELAVQKLSGVLGITNAVTVRPHAELPDIRRRIEQAVLRDADLRADRIHVDVEGGRVILTGTVEAWHDRGVAERAAWATPGVQEMEDRLTVL